MKRLTSYPPRAASCAFDAILERDDSNAVRRVACVTWGTGVVAALRARKLLDENVALGVLSSRAWRGDGESRDRSLRTTPSSSPTPASRRSARSCGWCRNCRRRAASATMAPARPSLQPAGPRPRTSAGAVSGDGCPPWCPKNVCSYNGSRTRFRNARAVHAPSGPRLHYVPRPRARGGPRACIEGGGPGGCPARRRRRRGTAR